MILGKVNLSELANYMSMKAPSGYSSKHGQTLNPYGPLKITPSGSSSGSAASVASLKSIRKQLRKQRHLTSKPLKHRRSLCMVFL